MMELTTDCVGGYDVVHLSGDVTAADTDRLEAALQRFLDLGRFQIVLDMENCTYIGSAGLTLLVRFARNFRHWNRGDLYLATVPAYIQDLLAIAGLVTEEQAYFRIYTSIAEALEAIGPTPDRPA